MQRKNERMSNTVFVDNLPRHLTNEDFQTFFQPYGSLRVIMAMSKAGGCLGFGFVVFASPAFKLRTRSRLSMERSLRESISASAPRFRLIPQWMWLDVRAHGVKRRRLPTHGRTVCDNGLHIPRRACRYKTNEIRNIVFIGVDNNEHAIQPPTPTPIAKSLPNLYLYSNSL